jgi:hypothetical protein
LRQQEHSALISDHLWRTHFAAAPGVAGRAIRLNDDVFAVMGVMPAGFHFPDWADLWLLPGLLYGDELTSRHPAEYAFRAPCQGLQGRTARLTTHALGFDGMTLKKH